MGDGYDLFGRVVAHARYAKRRHNVRLNESLVMMLQLKPIMSFNLTPFGLWTLRDKAAAPVNSNVRQLQLCMAYSYFKDQTA